MPTTDLIGQAINKNPVDFADTFNQIMMQKAADAVEAKRTELAQGVYASPENDEDLDDLDIDLDDLDLEDYSDDEQDD